MVLFFYYLVANNVEVDMIVVTGASGFIGSNLVNYLHYSGKKVLAVDDVRRDYISSDVEFMRSYDFMDIIHLLDDIEYIFHEGAISSTTETDWSRLHRKNVRYTIELIYECKRMGIPLQYASSASVYGNPSMIEWGNPNKQLNPLNKYANTKVICDTYAKAVMDDMKLIQGMRYFNVYGPNEDHKGDQASPYHKFEKQFKESGRIKLFEGSKEFFRDFIHVNKVIERKVCCLEFKPSGFYDVGTGKPKSFYDVALEIGGSDDAIDWIPMPDNLKEHYQKFTCANMGWV